MSSFSKRMGLKQPTKLVQLDDIDDDLRNSLWNVLDRQLFETSACNESEFTEVLWWHFFKKPVDTRPIHSTGFEGISYQQVWSEVREYFFSARWNEVYDFIEFVLKCYPRNDSIRQRLGHALATENAGFRIIDSRFVPISDESEVDEVSRAARDAFAPVSSHIKAAIAHLTDRSHPDYRNSIKESISAVEAMAKIVTGEAKATLEDALKTLERRGTLHPALKSAFSKMYGYTSDASGIRHALIDEDHLTQADARYFLVVCSAFINLLKSQAV